MGLIGRREHLRPMVQLAIWTAMRRGELLRLEIDLVNLNDIPRTFTVQGERIVLEPIDQSICGELFFDLRDG